MSTESKPELVGILLYPEGHELAGCMESFPCEHFVREVYSDGTIKEEAEWTGYSIYVHLNEKGLYIPEHFIECGKFDAEFFMDADEDAKKNTQGDTHVNPPLSSSSSTSSAPPATETLPPISDFFPIIPSHAGMCYR